MKVCTKKYQKMRNNWFIVKESYLQSIQLLIKKNLFRKIIKYQIMTNNLFLYINIIFLLQIRAHNLY